MNDWFLKPALAGGYPEAFPTGAPLDRMGARDGDLDRHLEDTRRQLAGSGQRLISARRAKLGNTAGALVEVALETKRHEVRTCMALVLRPGKLVMITYTALAKNWQQGKKKAEQLFGSIKVDDGDETPKPALRPSAAALDRCPNSTENRNCVP